MRLKITLTLLIILLGLLVYIFYIDPWEEKTDDRVETTNVLGERAAQIDYLRIAKTGERETITLEFQNNRWMLTAPYVWPANTYAVERIISQLQFLDAEVSFDTGLVLQAGSSLQEYGLSPPGLTLEFGQGDQRYTLGVGNATAVGNRLYVRSIDGEQIHVVNRSLLDSLSIELETLRDKNIFEIGIYEVESWNLQLGGAGNARTRFIRQDDQWNIETPIRARANSNAVNTLLNRILGIDSANIRMPENGLNLTALGLQPPEYRIAIETAHTREVLEIGAPIAPDQESVRIAKREDRPTIFEVDLEFLDILSNAQTLLRNRDVFSIDPLRATSVKFSRRNGDSFTLQKLENDEWDILQREDGNGLEAMRGDTEAIIETLEWLTHVRAVPDTGFVNDAPSAPDLERYGLEVPEMDIAITVIDPDTIATDAPLAVTETLQVGVLNREDRSERFVKLDERPYVYLVYNDVFDRIGTVPNDFVNREIYRLPDAQTIERIEIVRLFDKAKIFDETAAEAGQAFADLANELQLLRAESFVVGGYAESFEVTGAEETWEYSLNAYTNADTPPIQIRVSRLTGGPLLFGGLPQENLLFRFEQPFIDAFQEIVFDRRQRDLPEEPFPTESAAEEQPATESETLEATGPTATEASEPSAKPEETESEPAAAAN